jgi:hypothetical protein
VTAWRIRFPLTLGSCFAAMLLLGAVGDSVPSGPVVAGILSILALALPLGSSVVALFVVAHVPKLLGSHSVGALSAVDAMALAMILRAVLRPRAILSWLRDLADAGRSLPAIGISAAAAFIAVGAVATAISHENAAVTAFLRIAVYMAVSAALIPTLTREERSRALVAFVGVALADAVGAITGITQHGSIGGRYAGSLGDPAQFGIPIAAALLVVICAPWLVSRPAISVPTRFASGPWIVRLCLIVPLAIGLEGSRTRAAIVGAVVGGAGILAHALATRGAAARTRFLLGLALGGSFVLVASAFTLGAKNLGFDPVSARIRIESLHTAWQYMSHHPLRPTGLGNLPGPFPVYDTWVAISIALTPFAAAGLAVFVGSGIVSAWRWPSPEWVAVTFVFVASTITENIVFAASSATLTWFLVTGLAIGLKPGAGEPASGGSARPSPTR